MAAKFADQYRKLLADITCRGTSRQGYPLRAIEAAESQLGLRIPKPLRDYYLSVGRHELNRVHNRLLPPDALEIAQGRLIFMEENQCVFFWGVRSRTAAADPIVFQTTDLDEGNWVAEAPCSQFLSGMLCCHAGYFSMPHMGCSEPMDSVTVRKLMKGWPPGGRYGVYASFVRRGQVVCVEDSGKDMVLYLGANSSKSFKAMVSDLGVAVHDR